MGPAVLEKTEAERTQYSILSLYIYIYIWELLIDIMMRGKKRGFRGRGGGSMRGGMDNIYIYIYMPCLSSRQKSW